MRLSKVTRKLSGGFALFLVLTLIGTSYRQGITASFNAEASVANDKRPDGGPFKTQVRTFTGGGITIPTGGGGTPFPSDIVVSGVSPNATVAGITVTITGFTHNDPDDVDMLLVAPDTSKRIIFWSDVGGAPDATNLTITIDDAAAAQLPDAGPLVAGTFRPTDQSIAQTDNFTPASPCGGAPDGTGCSPADGAAPRGTATFANHIVGTVAAGTWSLYVLDDTAGTAGSIASWSINITFASPTLARMSSSSATVDDDGQVALKWKTGYEVDNLGFNVYRDEGGNRTRVNNQIIAGSAFVAGQGTAMSAGRNYKWRDNTSNPNAQYWIESLAIDGTSSWEGPVSLARSPGRTTPDNPSATLGDLNRNGPPKDGGNISLSSVVSEAGSSGKSDLKLGIKQTGYYRVTQPELIAAGLSSEVNPKKLQLFEDGNERPIFVHSERSGKFGPNDWIEFYATAANNAYTDTHVYRLVVGSQKGLRIKTAPEINAAGSQSSFLFTSELKERNIYYSALRNGEHENFFGAIVAREPVARALSLRNIAESAPDSATLEVSLQGITTSSHLVNVALNGTNVGAVTFDGQTAGVARIPVLQSSLREGENSVQLIAIGGDSDVSLVNTIQISYWHSYTADNDVLQFTAKAGERVTIGGFSNSAIRVMDLSDAEKSGVSELAATVNANGNGHSVTVGIGGAGTRTLLAFVSSQMKQPASIKADTASDWRQKGNKADLVIFTRKDFISALQPLKAHRESQGLRVVIADVEDAYDEFNFGNKHPQAIKDFLAYATSKWKVKPRFAIFAGDASLDPKNYLGSGDWDIVPTKLIDTQLMKAASDEWFADFNDDGLAELAVGRLPVRTAQEMATVVGKIIGYDNSSPSNSLLLVADIDDTFNFTAENEALRALMPGNVTTRSLSRGTVSDEAARAQVLSYLNEGQRVINYIGHGNLENWRGDLFTSEDASSLTNGQKLSLFVVMTCLNGYFQEVATESLAEALLKAPNGGAVATWASTGMSDPAEQGTLNKEFYRLLFGGGKLTIGEAAMKAKSAVNDKDVRRTWVLIGDPTTRLK
jgi:hypothetical protein